jgi:hypothetical protein
MSVPYLGDFAEDATVYMPFNTFDSNDPSASATITNLANTDVHVHKDGGAAQKTTSNGITVSIDFDTITGNHLLSIDTSNDAGDAGFWVTGSDYHVRVEGTTVDAATINAWIGHFSIQNRYSAGALRPTTAGRTLDVTSTGAAGIDWGNIENQSTAVDLSATDIQLCDTVTTNTDMRGTDNAALASVCTETRLSELDAGIGGKMANQVDVIEADTTVLNDTKIPDTISLANINAEVDTALADIGLDHLVSAAVVGADVTDNSIFARIVSSSATADWDSFVNTTDSLQAVRDHIGDGTNLTEAGGTGDHLTAIDLPNQTMDIMGNITGNLSGSVGSVAGNVDGNVTGSVGSLTATAVDNIYDEAMTETTGAPAVTGTFRDAWKWMFALSRNKITQTATTTTLRNDADSATLSSSTVSDDATTYTRGEWST